VVRIPERIFREAAVATAGTTRNTAAHCRQTSRSRVGGNRFEKRRSRTRRSRKNRSNNTVRSTAALLLLLQLLLLLLLPRSLFHENPILVPSDAVAVNATTIAKPTPPPAAAACI
jgi:hypothetical protein